MTRTLKTLTGEWVEVEVDVELALSIIRQDYHEEPAADAAGGGAMTPTFSVLVSDILAPDTRPAGWWLSEDGQGLIDMRGLSLSDARDALLSRCHSEEERAGIMAGHLDGWPTLLPAGR